MTFVIGQRAANRKLPADDILLADLAAGLKGSDIARKYGLHPSSVNAHISRNGLRQRAMPDSTPKRIKLCETPEKIIIRRETLTEGRNFRMVKVAISLPRIPTLHGFFAESLSSAQGASA